MTKLEELKKAMDEAGYAHDAAYDAACVTEDKWIAARDAYEAALKEAK
jgi:hypothetical protein